MKIQIKLSNGKVHESSLSEIIKEITEDCDCGYSLGAIEELEKRVDGCEKLISQLLELHPEHVVLKVLSNNKRWTWDTISVSK